MARRCPNKDCRAFREPLARQCPKCDRDYADVEKENREKLLKLVLPVVGGIVGAIAGGYGTYLKLQSEVHGLVKAEFEQPQIHATVEQAGEDIINNVLKPKTDRLENQVNDVEGKVRTAEQQMEVGLGKVTSTLTQLQESQRKADSTLDIERQLLAAQVDDRNAWANLSVIAHDKTSPYAPIAEAVQQKVIKDSMGGLVQGWTPEWFPPFGPKPQQWDVDTIETIYKRLAPDVDEHFVDTVLQRTEMSSRARGDFAMSVAKTSSSIAVTECAGRHILQLLNRNHYPDKKVPDNLTRLPSLLVSYVLSPQWEQMRLFLPDNDARAMSPDEETRPH